MNNHTGSKGEGRMHNRLLYEKSPYLLQHAYNPVDWYPWGEEAFEKAERENKPVFLSIGYSTCHWCHVMAHESFEDLEVARLMNETFVPVKVDREERPDIDGIYMSACTALTGKGGWPLTILMTHDKRPFFAGTYFPKTRRFGSIGMLDLIPYIKEVWQKRHGEVIDAADKLLAELQGASRLPRGEGITESVMDMAFDQLSGIFDQRNGGFGGAPKFPAPHTLTFLLRYWKRHSNDRALRMVEHTLHAMGQGGIYDHAGFGFHRYSTDSLWLVPHFEKMLYDQALLAIAYTEAYQATKREEFGETAKEIFGYVLRDMRSGEGGFYSAEDADSEGTEGKFYLWTKGELRDALGEEDAGFIAYVYTIGEDGDRNGEHYHDQDERLARRILHLRNPLETLATELAMPLEQFKRRMDGCRKRLFDARERRPHPHKDDKVLTDWNGLMIGALAIGARVFDEPLYEKAAQDAAGFILNNMFTPEGRLFHRYRDKDAGIQANLDDYAFFIWGLTELYETTFICMYLKKAIDLTEDLLVHFWDKGEGGLFFTPDDGEGLIVRKKETYDGALPSGNSIVMLNLLRLARITANTRYEDMASKIAGIFSYTLRQSPIACTQFLSALDFAIGPAREIVVAGRPDAAETKLAIRRLREAFYPNKVVILRPVEEHPPEIDGIVPLIKDFTQIDNRTTIYVCKGNRCELPTTNIDEAIRLMQP